MEEFDVSFSTVSTQLDARLEIGLRDDYLNYHQYVPTTTAPLFVFKYAEEWMTRERFQITVFDK